MTKPVKHVLCDWDVNAAVHTRPVKGRVYTLKRALNMPETGMLIELEEMPVFWPLAYFIILKRLTPGDFQNERLG